MYDPTKQYRCTIIRGKAKTDLDDLLPKYAKVIQTICPCHKNEFPSIFNSLLEKVVGGSKKTLDNHRTEIAGKLFGMYYYNEHNIVYSSERTLKFLENEDQPAFFKDICAKMQFPNGMDSIHTIKDRLSEKINIRQFSFILELLNIANLASKRLTKDELAYFVLNNLDVLQGNVEPYVVYEKIAEYRKQKTPVKVQTPGKASSYAMQHINEQLNLLELANLIRIERNIIFLNPHEMKSIDYIRSLYNKSLDFDIYQYKTSSIEDRKKIIYDWQLYFSKVDKGGLDLFNTSISALQFNHKEASHKTLSSNKIDLGDDGEAFVYQYEKNRVEKYDRRLVNKVLLLGKTKGLGYDIQSILANGSRESEFVQYIEVKATKRVTYPREGTDGWVDSVNLTRNEWVAAEQHSKSYSVYRVYFTPDKTIVYIMNNPFLKNQKGDLRCTPISYRLDFSMNCIDQTFFEEV